MNIQELKEQVSSLPSELIFKKVMVNKDSVRELIDQLDELKKVVIPKFVAEYIKEYKEANLNIYNLLTEHPPEVGGWLNYNYKERLDTFARAWLDGYEIEQEKLYTVEIPDPNRKGKNRVYLVKDPNTSKVFVAKGNFNPATNRQTWLTETEIRKDFDWAWQAGFAKEVE